MQCLGLILPTDQNNGLAAFKERLADWIITNYFDIKYTFTYLEPTPTCASSMEI